MQDQLVCNATDFRKFCLLKNIEDVLQGSGVDLFCHFMREVDSRAYSFNSSFSYLTKNTSLSRRFSSYNQMLYNQFNTYYNSVSRCTISGLLSTGILAFWTYRLELSKCNFIQFRQLISGSLQKFVYLDPTIGLGEKTRKNNYYDFNRLPIDELQKTYDPDNCSVMFYHTVNRKSLSREYVDLTTKLSFIQPHLLKFISIPSGFMVLCMSQHLYNHPNLFDLNKIFLHDPIDTFVI